MDFDKQYETVCKRCWLDLAVEEGQEVLLRGNFPGGEGKIESRHLRRRQRCHPVRPCSLSGYVMASGIWRCHSILPFNTLWGNGISVIHQCTTYAKLVSYLQKRKGGTELSCILLALRFCSVTGEENAMEA